MTTHDPIWLEEIDHTGDVGIRVTASSLPELFERAALGMFSVLTDVETVRPDQPADIEVQGRDREALMVRWLSELNYHHNVDHVVYRESNVESIDESKDGISLHATVLGEPIDPDRHTIYTEIKAVTFHGLEIQETNDGWSVQVIFDM